MTGYYGALVQVLRQTSDGATIVEAFRRKIAATIEPERQSYTLNATLQALEVMVQEDWIVRAVNKNRPLIKASNKNSHYIRDSATGDAALAVRASSEKPVSTKTR